MFPLCTAHPISHSRLERNSPSNLLHGSPVHSQKAQLRAAAQSPCTMFVLSNRPYPTPNATSSPTQQIHLPPTPQRQSWIYQQEALMSARLRSQQLRNERKHTTYVNSSIHPTRDQGLETGPTTSNATTPNVTTSNGGRAPPPPAPWSQLLPYRTSTVPQALSERLKKSDTLPNDVWLRTQQTGESNLGDKSNTYRCSHTSENPVAPIPGPKSPPPKPPIRTTSHKYISIVPEIDDPKSPTVQHRRPPEKPSHTSIRKAYENSPVLCRYSQLYALPGMARHGKPASGMSHVNPAYVEGRTKQDLNESAFRSRFEQMNMNR